MADTGATQANHDEFVAKCFQDLALAVSFLRHYLPAEILEQVDLQKISLQQGSYVDEDLRRSYSDLSYTVPLRDVPLEGSSSRAYIYILVEHKSESDEFTVFQLLRYMVRIWQRELEEANYRAGFRLPPIVPLILHHGRTEFRAPVEFKELVAGMDGTESFVPNYQCLLIDLMRVSSEELPSRDPRLHAVLSVMRSVFGEEIHQTLRDVATRLAVIMERRETRDTLAAVLSYVLQSASRMSDEDFLAAIKPLGKAGDETMSTLIDKWREEGREEGVEKGVRKGIEKGRIEDRQDSIIDFLIARFESVPEPLCENVRAILDADRLVQLTTLAAKCKSLDEFAANLK